jgi:hypothetical protein
MSASNTNNQPSTTTNLKDEVEQTTTAMEQLTTTEPAFGPPTQIESLQYRLSRETEVLHGHEAKLPIIAERRRAIEAKLTAILEERYNNEMDSMITTSAIKWTKESVDRLSGQINEEQQRQAGIEAHMKWVAEKDKEYFEWKRKVREEAEEEARQEPLKKIQLEWELRQKAEVERFVEEERRRKIAEGWQEGMNVAGEEKLKAGEEGMH